MQVCSLQERVEGEMVEVISLTAASLGLWLLLSGHYTALLIGLGIASSLLVVLISYRMDVVDHEGHPVRLGPRALAYWPWLLVEIVKSNIDVAWRILDPAMPISPTLVRLKASQRTELGQVIYANSITLTPGTVSMELEDGMIHVHALTSQGAASLQEGEMDRRVAAMESRGP